MKIAACLAALALATSTLVPQIADACGGSYGDFKVRPQPVLLTSHMNHPTQVRHTFAILGKAKVAATAKWERVSPSSYDYVMMTKLGKLEQAETFTLVGPSGNRVVHANQRVVLKHVNWKMDSMVETLKLPTTNKDDFAIALRGDVSDAVWHAPHYRYTPDFLIEGTDLRIWPKYDDGKPTFELRHGKSILIGTFSGSVLGAVDTDGARYLIVDNDGVATTLEVQR